MTSSVKPSFDPEEEIVEDERIELLEVSQSISLLQLSQVSGNSFSSVTDATSQLLEMADIDLPSRARGRDNVHTRYVTCTHIWAIPVETAGNGKDKLVLKIMYKKKVFQMCNKCCQGRSGEH